MDRTTPPASQPDDVVEARQQFDEWRRTRTGQGRISDDLWAVAVKVAAKHGVHPAARMLQVDYKCLKARVREAAAFAGQPKTKDAPVTFVEVHPAIPRGSPTELILDLEQLVCGITEEES